MIPIRWAWKPLLLAVLVASGLFVSYRQGFQTAFDRQQAVIEAQKQEKSAALLATAEAYAAHLEQALDEQKKWQAFAQSESAKLAAANRTLDRQAAQLDKEIQNVIRQDKSKSGSTCVDGLGADGLRLYRRALGYAD